MSGLSTEKLAAPLKTSSSDGVRLSRSHNAASSVVSTFTPTPIRLQPKLTVNTPGDKYEQEADRVADMVMRKPEPTVQCKCATSGSPTFCDGKGTDWKTETQGIGRTLQRVSASGHASAGMSAPPIVRQVLNSTGSPLPADTRSLMESRFGQDFTGVRIHTDSHANASARELSARAYTVGRHVAFAAGEFQPDTSSGRWLLAHELAHTVQQDGFIRRKVDERRDTADHLLNEGVSFVATPIGAELFERPDKSSKVLRKLPDCQRVRRVSFNESLGGNWEKIVVNDFLGGGLVGFIDRTVLKTPPENEIANDPGLKLYRVKDGETFWDLVKREYGINGNESTADLNINHFINAIRSKNKPEAFGFKERSAKSIKEAFGDLLLDTSHGRDASDTELKSNVLIWIPSYISAIRMDVGSGTVTGEVARIRKKVEQKLNDFRNALAMSGPLFLDAMSQYAGEFGPQLITGLVTFAKEATVILAGSTAVGALIGALFGGAGAVPGASIGFEVGLLILQIYGIYEAISGALGVLRTSFLMLGQAISLTWHANGDPKAIREAAMAFANAFAVLSTLALTALFAYIAKKGFDAIKGTKFAKTVGESKLAEWFSARKSRDSLKQPRKERSANTESRQTHDAGRDTEKQKTASATEKPDTTGSQVENTLGEETPGQSATSSQLTTGKSQDPSLGNLAGAKIVNQKIIDDFVFTDYRRPVFKPWGSETLREARGNLRHIEPGDGKSKQRHAKARKDFRERNEMQIGDLDQAGHKVARELGGPAVLENLDKQNNIANAWGTWRQLEKQWLSKLDNGVEIEVRVVDVFKEGSHRPYKRNVEWVEKYKDGTMKKFNQSQDMGEVIYGNFPSH